MATAREQMKTVETELERVQGEMARLKIEEDTLKRLLAKMGSKAVPSGTPRKRAPNVKPVVLDIMESAGAVGATSAEVDMAVREKVPTVAKDTVASVLSRLKSDGALTFNGERYFHDKFRPRNAVKTILDGGVPSAYN